MKPPADTSGARGCVPENAANRAYRADPECVSPQEFQRRASATGLDAARACVDRASEASRAKKQPEIGSRRTGIGIESGYLSWFFSFRAKMVGGTSILAP